jgi:hypothetical protein
LVGDVGVLVLLLHPDTTSAAVPANTSSRFIVIPPD